MEAAFLFPVVVVADVPLTLSWADFKDHFGMTSNGEEDNTREQVFTANMAFIEVENAKDNTYTLGVNHFSHLSLKEFQTQYTGGKGGSALSSNDAQLGELEVQSEIASSIERNMKAAFLLPVAAVADVPLTMSWADFKDHFGMTFNGEEDTTREQVLTANMAFIEVENAKDNTYTLGVNHFSHLSLKEVQTQYGKGGSALSSNDAQLALMSWADFQEHFGMTFNGEEDTTREQVFTANMAFIEAVMAMFTV